jgi:hypothetical protein
MSPDEKNAIIQRELMLVDIYISNLRNISGWRLPTIAVLAADARKSLRKTAALIGYTGQWWRDVGLYLATLLPIAIPVNLALGATIFTSIATSINSALSVVEMESRVIQKTIEVPFLWFFTKREVISETIQIPVIRTPDVWIAPAITTAVLAITILITSWALKYLWTYELQYRTARTRKLWSQTLRANSEETGRSAA